MDDFKKASEYISSMSKEFMIYEVRKEYGFRGVETTFRGKMLFEGGEGDFSMTFCGDGIQLNGNSLPDLRNQ